MRSLPPPQTDAPPASPADPALAQAERLAWLFRHDAAGAAPHPLWQPLACLRGATGPAWPPLAVAAPWPARPRQTSDRAWLRDRVAALPALPQAVTEALRVLGREASGASACAEALGRDPALAAQVLRLANAAAYGRSGRIGTLAQAVALLGRDRLARMLTAAAVAGQFDRAACAGFDAQQFWREALACGIAAQALAQELGLDEGLAFSAGLLHDLGHLALVSQLPAAMAQVLAWARQHDQPLHGAEQEVLGLDHAEVGAMLARHWQFPPEVVAAIAGHHAPDAPAAGGEAGPWTDLVRAADAVAHALDLHQCDTERVPGLPADLVQRLQLTPERFARVLTVTELGVDAAARGLAP